MPPSSAALRALARVMLVDDNPFDNEFHATILRKAGFAGEFVVCETGEDALAWFAAEGARTVDLLLLDVNLPGASGFDIARKLGELAARNPRFALVMLSSSPDARDVAEARSIPLVRAFRTKPLGLAGVAELVPLCFPGG